MGRFFERILIQDKGPGSYFKLRARLPKAAAAIGYTTCTENHGVPVILKDAITTYFFGACPV